MALLDGALPSNLLAKGLSKESVSLCLTPCLPSWLSGQGTDFTGGPWPFTSSSPLSHLQLGPKAWEPSTPETHSGPHLRLVWSDRDQKLNLRKAAPEGCREETGLLPHLCG